MTRLVLLSLGAVALLSACKHVPTEKEMQGSSIHYDLCVQAVTHGNMQEAYAECEESLQMDETNSRAHNAMGQLLHLGFNKPLEAIPHYQRAIELDKQFSEAHVNLGNVYLSMGEYPKAIAEYEVALNDMRYATPYIAEANLGWAEYKRGNTEKAIDSIKSAITVNPKFCLGYRNLGQIYEDTGRLEDACTQFSHYREQCPDSADAYYRDGLCLAKLGRNDEARELFAQCEGKAPIGDLKDDCHRWSEQLK